MAAVKGLAEELGAVGRAAGLAAVGVCDASPFEAARQALLAGRNRGWDAGMQFTYRNPARSTDPSRTLPGAAALVVGAYRYERRRDAAPQQGTAPMATVARYAWRDHYRPLRTALEAVAGHLRERGWKAVVLADDNALVDRAAAVRAGIGWYGKNTNVLLPDVGSWFVLGSVVTDAPLVVSAAANTAESPSPPGASSHSGTGARGLLEEVPNRTLGPVPDGCGGCRRCMDACPTGALTEAGHLDGRRCLAWLLQATGPFPREHRVALGGRLYGCDDCQEACPINRLATRRDPAPAAEPDARAEVDVLDVLTRSDAELIDQFGRWYIPNREPRYLRRNALVVLGNIADPTSPRVRQAIGNALRDPDPLIRAHAVWAAGRLGLHRGLPAHDSDPAVRDELAGIGAIPVRNDLPVANYT